MKKDRRQSFDEFYSPTDVAEVVSGYEELAAADARSRKFNSDVFGILSKHVPQVLFAIGIGVVVGGLVRGEAKAAGHDGFHGGRHVGPDDSGDGGNHTSIGSTQILRTDGMQMWVDSHIKFGTESNVPEKSMLDATGLSFESLWGLGQVDLVDLTEYGDEGSYGTRAIMDQAIYDLGQNKIDVDLNKVFIATFSDDLTVVRSASTSSNGRPSVGSEMGENSSIVYAFDKDGNPHAVFDVNADGQATGIRPNSKNTQIAILDLIRGEQGTSDENKVGYTTLDGRFVSLIDFSDMKNVKATVPIKDHEGNVSSVKIRARISASDFPTSADREVSNVGSTEAGLATQAILDQIGVPEGVVELQMKGDDVVCTEVETQKQVCKNGKFNTDFLQRMTDLFGNPIDTGYEEKKGNNKQGVPPDEIDVTYALDLFNRAMTANVTNGWGFDMALGRGGGYRMVKVGEKSWAMIRLENPKNPDAPKFWIYENENKEIIIVPII